MKYKTVWGLEFSPSGTTKTAIETMSSQFSGEKKHCDLLKEPKPETQILKEDDLLIVGFPVFAGRLPQPCTSSLKSFKGTKTPAIAVVIYGNRDYDDALLELTDILEEQGFVVIGAAAFIAHHSMFPNVGIGRPDESDRVLMDNFSKKCMEILETFEASKSSKINVKGNKPYKEIMDIPVKPSGDSKCTGCNICVEICPVKAISAKNPKKTDKKKCISCTACIAACPEKSRNYRGPIYKAVCKKFDASCAERKEPEMFF